MLTAIEIENFKSIGDRQRIELAPITLLFGPNSAGKSSIFDAIHFMRNQFGMDVPVDPSAPQLPPVTDLIHNKDAGRTMKFRLEGIFEDGAAVGESYFTGTKAGQEKIRQFRRDYANTKRTQDEPPENRDGEGQRQVNPNVLSRELADYRHFLQWHLRSWSVEVHFELRKDAPPFLPAWANATFGEFGINGAPVVQWRTTKNISYDIEAIASPLWSQGNSFQLYGRSQNIPPEERELRFRSHFETLKEKAGNTGTTCKGSSLIGWDGIFAGESYGISTKSNWTDIIPRPGTLAPLDSSDTSSEETPAHRVLHDDVVLSSQIEMVMQTAAGTMARSLCSPATYLASQNPEHPDLLHVGPLRSIPKAGQTDHSQGGQKWYKGEHAWRFPGQFLTETLNQWLETDPTEEATFAIKETALVPGEFLESLGESETSDPEAAKTLSPSKLQELKGFPRKRELLLKNKHGGFTLPASQVGVGLSQAVPVVAAAIALSDSRWVFIEQPELHLHPRLQVGLADIIARHRRTSTPRPIYESAVGTYILETHSEILMLRFCRLIEDPKHALKSSDLSVNFLSKQNGETKIAHIRVDEDGEFIDRWPEGFFEEREKELFGD